MSITRLSPLVRVVLAPNPSPMTLEGTNTYIVGERAPIVIDPGPADEGHLARVLAEARDPSVVLLTHRHPDHAEGAARFASLAGLPAPVPAPDKARTVAAGVSLLAIATPGHSSDHVCFLFEEERAVFTGDHVLGRGTTVIAFPDGELASYLASLDRLAAVHPQRFYPGHGPVVEDPAPVLAYYRAHRLEREAQILDAIDAGDVSVEQVVARVYADVAAVLHPVAAMSVRAHLEKLRAERVLVEKEPACWQRF